MDRGIQMQDSDTPRTMAEVDEIASDEVGDFVRKAAYEDDDSARVAMWVYEPECTDEMPSGWALGLCRGAGSAWLDAYRWSSLQDGYMNLRDIEDADADEIEDLVDLAEAILAEVSEVGDTDLFETIDRDDVQDRLEEAEA